MAKKEKASKNTKKKIIIICILIVLISFMSVFARYMLNVSTDFFTRAQKFPFYSDKLREDNPNYQLENWGGGEPYPITINMSSKENELIFADYDIEYSISAKCSENIDYSLSKTEGIIYAISNKDSFSVTIIPNSSLETGDVVWVDVTVVVSEPFEKTLSARFTMKIGKENITYSIVDSAYSPYLEVVITNTLSSYTVETAFGPYSSGAIISREVYRELGTTDQAKCYSAKIRLQFDPNIIVVDMTNENYLKATNFDTATKGGFTYIKDMTFKVDAITGTRVRFYKMDAQQNYTYPSGSSSPVVTVTATGM